VRFKFSFVCMACVSDSAAIANLSLTLLDILYLNPNLCRVIFCGNVLLLEIVTRKVYCKNGLGSGSTYLSYSYFFSPTYVMPSWPSVLFFTR
jgi:hypothetical protein